MFSYSGNSSEGKGEGRGVYAPTGWLLRQREGGKEKRETLSLLLRAERGLGKGRGETLLSTSRQELGVPTGLKGKKEKRKKGKTSFGKLLLLREKEGMSTLADA